MPLGSVNVMLEPVDALATPSSVTDHDVPDGRPVSVSVTVYVTSIKVTDLDTDAPFTVKLPPFEDHDLLTVAMLYVYVALGSLNVIADVMLWNDCPLVRLTNHSVPDGRPDSVNVMA